MRCRRPQRCRPDRRPQAGRSPTPRTRERAGDSTVRTWRPGHRRRRGEEGRRARRKQGEALIGAWSPAVRKSRAGAFSAGKACDCEGGRRRSTDPGAALAHAGARHQAGVHAAVLLMDPGDLQERRPRLESRSVGAEDAPGDGQAARHRADRCRVIGWSDLRAEVSPMAQPTVMQTLVTGATS